MFFIFCHTHIFFFFFFNDTATTEIYTLSLHDALPIFTSVILTLRAKIAGKSYRVVSKNFTLEPLFIIIFRSEEHTSELQSQSNLVCRLLLEKKKILHEQKYL